MTGQESRYDRIAEGYATYWSPVHRAATLQLLDDVAPDAVAGRARVLDVGCGTGAMSVEAARRWPEAEIEATDISVGMLAVAARTVTAAGGQGRRVHLTRAAADRRALRLFPLHLHAPGRLECGRCRRRIARLPHEGSL